MLTRTRLILLAALAAVVAVTVLYSTLRAEQVAQPSSGQTQADQSSGGQGHNRQGSGGQGGSGPIAVVTAVATRKDVPNTRAAIGIVEPIAAVAVRPRVDGVIVEQAIQGGETVKKGDLLFRLDDAVIRATIAKDQAQIEKDQAALDQANADLKRLQTLRGHGDVTEQQLEQQQAAAKGDEAAVALDRAQLNADQVQLAYATITAPIAGRVGTVNATTGNLVRSTDQSPLLTITEMAPLRVSFTVPERDLSAYRSALAGSASVAVRALDATSGQTRGTGKLTFIDSAVDTGSGTITIKAEFTNQDQSLWPGEYVRTETDLAAQKDATVVPLVAVQVNDKGSFVYRVDPAGTVAAAPVTLASADGETAVIASGVQPGDHVVVEGQLHLANGARVKETAAPPKEVTASAS